MTVKKDAIRRASIQGTGNRPFSREIDTSVRVASLSVASQKNIFAARQALDDASVLDFICSKFEMMDVSGDGKLKYSAAENLVRTILVEYEASAETHAEMEAKLREFKTARRDLFTFDEFLIFMSSTLSVWKADDEATMSSPGCGLDSAGCCVS